LQQEGFEHVLAVNKQSGTSISLALFLYLPLCSAALTPMTRMEKNALIQGLLCSALLSARFANASLRNPP